MTAEVDLSTRRPKNAEKRQCTATTKHGERAGKRCKNRPINGGTVCHKHGGSAPQVKNRARQRLLGAIDPAMVEMLNIAFDRKKDDNVRLKALAWILERGGFDLKQQVEVSVTQLDEARSRMLDLLSKRMQSNTSAEVLDLDDGADADVVDAEIVEETPPPPTPQVSPNGSRPKRSAKPPRYDPDRDAAEHPERAEPDWSL